MESGDDGDRLKFPVLNYLYIPWPKTKLPLYPTRIISTAGSDQAMDLHLSDSHGYFVIIN